MTVVRMSEMYDMCTVKGKIGVVGIHTPTISGMAKRWKGFFDNHRFYKILGCDIKVACASVLPADPLQVGVESGDIAPQDMMNPILYTTMTNEGWNALVNRVYVQVSSSSGFDAGSVRALPDAFPSLNESNQELLYYSMLSSDKFRKAMPQAGFSMNNVKPFVHQIVSTFGSSSDTIEGDSKKITITQAGASASVTSENSTGYEVNQLIRGKALPYPRLPCSLPGSTAGTSDFPLPQGVPLLDCYAPNKTYCACVVLPPAKLHEFYYRMIVTWRIAFIQPCTILEKLRVAQLGDTSDIYLRQYSYSSAKDLEPVEDGDTVGSVGSVEALNMSPSLVMEK